MTKQTKIYLVRHGESTHNKQSMISGHGDPRLTDLGRKQIRHTKENLSSVKFDVAYSSDLIRAIETAEIIFSKPVSKNHQIYDFRERNFGSLEGKPDGHLKAAHKKKQTMTHEESLVYKHVPDMESDHELSLRFIPALAEVAKQNFGKTILVVAHGGAIRATITQLAGLTYNDLPSGSFKNAGYVELTYDDAGFKVIQISGVKI